MKNVFSLQLELEDIARIRALAADLKLPPHVLARSILLRGLDEECQNWGMESAPTEAPILHKKPGLNVEIQQSSEVSSQ